MVLFTLYSNYDLPDIFRLIEYNSIFLTINTHTHFFSQTQGKEIKTQHTPFPKLKEKRLKRTHEHNPFPKLKENKCLHKDQN